MIVVCDTSPICYLILIQHIDLLPRLFGKVFIPPAVEAELFAEGAFSEIRTWIASPPDWLQIQPASSPLLDLPANLGAGEQEAISLARELRSALIILDDFDARQAAVAFELTVTGLLGVLYRAGIDGFIDFPQAIGQLQQTSFRASPQLLQGFLEKYQQAKGEWLS